MNAEQGAREHAASTLQAELSLVDASEKLRKWKRPIGKRHVFFWKCPCGDGMRYSTEVNMRKGVALHKLRCNKAKDAIA